MNISSVRNYNFNIDNVLKYLIIFVPITIMIGNFLLNINIILIDLIFLLFLSKKKILLKKKIYLILLFLSTICIFNIFYSSNINLSIQGSLGLLKYIIFFFALVHFLDNDENKNLFFKFVFYVILFVIIDVFIQYFFGKDIFGFEYSMAHGKRLSGPFGDEYVVGAYISKLSYLGLFYLINLKKNYFFIFFYLCLIVVSVFITQERSAFFITIISSVFFILVNKYSIKYKIYFLLFLCIFIGLFLKIDKSSYDKYLKLTPLQLGMTEEIHKRSSDFKSPNNHKIESFWDSRYGAHFLTAYNIYIDNKVIGSGIKTFRSACELDKYANIESLYADKRCNTHPHNIYFEILSEGGLIIFIPFSLIVLFFVIYNFKNLFSNKDNIIYVTNLSIMIVLFFPIQTTGSFFSTFNGVFYWIGAAVIVQNLKYDFFRRSI